MPGLYYEQCEPGLVVAHEVRRTVTEADNVLFTTMSMNTARLHLDAHHMADTPFGRPLVNSLFTLALVVGLSVTDVAFDVSIANLGFDAVKFPAPVFHGDTIRAETEIVERRLSSSRPNAGIVTYEHRGFNQDDALVCSVRRTTLVKTR